MSKGYEALGTQDLEASSPPGYLRQHDHAENEEGTSGIPLSTIPTNPAESFTFGQSTEPSNAGLQQIIPLAEIGRVYGSAGLIQVGQPFDSFQCLVDRSNDFDILKQQIAQELAESKPDLELVALTVPGEQHQRGSRSKLNAGSWSKLRRNLSVLGLVTKRKEVVANSQSRKALLTFVSVFTFVLVFTLTFSATTTNKARTPSNITVSLQVTFTEPVAAGEQRTIQCVNNFPKLLAKNPV